MALILRIEVRPGTDSNTREMCRLYWAQPEHPTTKRPFAYSADEIGQRFGLSRIALARKVEAACYAFDPARTCTACGKPLHLSNRSDYELYRHGERECDDCTSPRAASFFSRLQGAIEHGLETAPDDPELSRRLQGVNRQIARSAKREARRFRE